MPEFTMPCLIVGGCANGVILPSITADAQEIALRRPHYIKPLASTQQELPEVAHEMDHYIVHPLGLVSDDGELHLYGIGVLVGVTLPDAIQRVFKAYVNESIMQLHAAKLMQDN
jgi:hypothetical protein